ncbi:MAG: hypothetical protein ACPLW7_03005 [Minisyncoccia bacterium]
MSDKNVQKLIPLEILFGEPDRMMPKISSDGTKIAYLAPNDGVLNIWLRSIDKNDDRVITKEKKR